MIVGPTFEDDVLTRNRNGTLALRNGTTLFKAFSYIEFEAATGLVQINSNGDRVMNISVSNFFNTSNWTSIGQYNGVNLSMHASPVWSSNSSIKPWGQAEINLAALLPKGAASEADNTLGKYVEQAIYLALDWTNANTALLDGYTLVTRVADTRSLSGPGQLAVSFVHAVALSVLSLFLQYAQSKLYNPFAIIGNKLSHSIHLNSALLESLSIYRSRSQ